ncbi:MAG: hypothetical protein DRJ42_07705 [Deltaproteobacteria bacterium]|nr:MAG: hypothetical protein DRJ42_07705 [Deltaproteobacteria bacterium]
MGLGDPTREGEAEAATLCFRGEVEQARLPQDTGVHTGSLIGDGDVNRNAATHAGDAHGAGAGDGASAVMASKALQMRFSMTVVTSSGST